MKKGELSNFNKAVLMDDKTAVETSSCNPYLMIFIGKDDRISRIHCEIKRSNGTITVEDKGSKNGT